MKAYLVFDEDEKKPVWTGWMMEQLRERGHEIEIPDGAEGLSISEWDKRYKRDPVPCLCNIPIPRKKKVKKWRWEICSLDGIVWRTEKHHTEEEIQNVYGCKAAHRIDDSMIEVGE
jgi:hypothetical protein